MIFDKLFEVIDNAQLEDGEQLIKIMRGLDNESSSIWLIDEIADMLKDWSPLFSMITDKNKIALVRLIRNLFPLIVSRGMGELVHDKVIEFAFEDIAYINDGTEERIATKKEYEQGVKGLICKRKWNIDEEDYKSLRLLTWILDGKSYDFTGAGYKLTFKDSNVPTETTYEMIYIAAERINNIKDLLERYEDLVTRLKNYKKKGRMKYPAYSRYEVVEDYTVKQLLNNIDISFKRGSKDENYRRALSLVINAKRGKTLTPFEISFLRTTYERHAADLSEAKDKVEDIAEEDNKVKKMCMELLDAKRRNAVDKKEFGFKIIDSLARNNFTKCSEKQFKIIDDLYQKAFNKTAATRDNGADSENKVTIISEENMNNTLSDMYDMINSGNLFE